MFPPVNRSNVSLNLLFKENIKMFIVLYRTVLVKVSYII